jgi:hypothetical protein
MISCDNLMSKMEKYRIGSEVVCNLLREVAPIGKWLIFRDVFITIETYP